jgi:hypothetical protein
MRDVQAQLEQSRNAIVTQVVKMEILDREQAAGPRESGADRVGADREYALVVSRPCLQDPQRWIGQVAPDVVADFLARILHIAHQDALAVQI